MMLKFGSENKEITEKCPNAPFVLSINDNDDNELIVVIALPISGEKGEDLDISTYPNNDNPEIQKILFNSYPVYEDMERVYEIKFESYIIYQCRNESYTYWQKDEVRKGKYLIIFEKSRFLDYYESVIFDFDSDDWKSNRKHYGIYTENHIIDVIANKPPIITKINSDLSSYP